MSVTLANTVVRELHYWMPACEHHLTFPNAPVVSGMSVEEMMRVFRSMVAPFHPEISNVSIREFNPVTGQTYATHTYNV